MIAYSGDFKKAKTLIKDLANNGNTDAQYLLSKYYRDPNGLDKLDIGEKWLYKAANNNNARAQHCLEVFGWVDNR